MRPAPVPPELLRGPFRLSDARLLGVSEQTLRGDRFRAPFAGVRVAVTLEDTIRLRAAAALLALPPRSVLSCHTAAEIRNLPLPRIPGVPVAAHAPEIHASVSGVARTPRVKGIYAHLRTGSSVVVGGLAVSTPAGMFLELGEHLSLLELVTIGDALVRRSWISLDDLRSEVGTASVRRGLHLSRRAAALARARVDSPMETAIRLLIVLAGLPCPEPGFRVMDDGLVVGFVDLALAQFRIVIEYDGDLHRTRKKKWRSDVGTRDALRELGWTVIVLTWDDYAVTPARTVGRVARALARAGCTTVPTTWKDGHVDERDLSVEWRTAFPGAGRQAWEWADAPSW